MKKLEKGANSTTGEIGRKVDEIVAWINEHENADGTNTADTDVQDTDATAAVQYPNFEKWKTDVILTDAWNNGEFLQLAPENFYIIKDDKRKDYFTWDEAMEYEEKVLKPNGWRLPTCQEWAKICACYVAENGSDDAKRFMKELKMKKSGYIAEDDVKNGVRAVNSPDYGYFWSSISYAAPSARGLNFDSNALYPQNTYYKGFGFSVRCVKERK